jgi:hypothetical protein
MSGTIPAIGSEGVGDGVSPRPLSPVEAMNLSRRRLRDALLPDRLHGGRFHGGRMAGATADGDTSAPWLVTLKSLSLIGVLFAALDSWWAQHPLRVAMNIASDTAKAVAQPMARENPLGLMLGVVVLGAAIVWSRPWRWLLRPALFAGLVPQLVSKVAAAVPLQSLMEAFAATLSMPRKQKPALTHREPPAASGSRREQARH